MTVMKTFRNLIRGILIHSMIFSLIQTSFIQTSMAQDNTNQNAMMLLNAVNQGVQTYGNVMMQQKQSQAAYAAQVKNAQMMQMLGPNCVTKDPRTGASVPCHMTAGKYFPECRLPPTIAPYPNNVCSQPMRDINQAPAQGTQMRGYADLSQAWVDSYTLMLNPASNAAMPEGIKCLEDKKKALDSQLTEMGNNLTRLQEQIAKELEPIKAHNKKLLEEMATTNDELFGPSGKNNLKLKTLDFSKLFSQSCQSVIGDDGLGQIASGGLAGVLQGLSPASKRAADYNNNRNSIETEVRNDIQKIQNSIKEGGLQNYFDGKFTESSKYKSLLTATQKQAAEFKLAKDRIAEELKKLNYDLPTMDKNFDVDFSEFVNVANTHFKKQYINDCVTGADRSGIAISTSDILKSLQQKSTKSSGTARDKYRAALEGILNSDEFFEKKMQKIKALEATYKDITITYQSANAQRITETPYDLYIKTLDKCEQRYTQNDISTSAGSNGVSAKKKVERGQALLRELQSLHNNFSSRLAGKVLDQVLTCNGESKKSGATCGAPDSFDHTSPSFCMSHANECSNEVSACYNEASKHVETRKAKLTTLATSFNNNAKAIVARSNQILNSQKASVMELIKIVQSRFPGTNFDIAANMFVAMPEMKKDAFGLELANDGNMSFIEDFHKKVDLMKKMFKDQQAKVDDEVTDYIAKQQQAMETQRSRFADLADECRSQADGIDKEIAKYNQNLIKQKSERDAAVGAFCNKYSLMKQNPLGACDDVKSLAESMDKVQARITNQALKYTQDFRNTCNKFNNEATSINSECPDSTEGKEFTQLSREMRALCKAQIMNHAASLTEAGKKPNSRIGIDDFCTSPTTSEKDFIKSVAETLSDEDKEVLKSTTSLTDVSNKRKTLSFEADNFFKGIISIKNSSSETELCKTLTKIENGDVATETRSLKKKLKDLDDQLTSDTNDLEAKKTAATAEREKAIKEKNEEKKKEADDNIKTASDAIAAKTKTAEKAKKEIEEEIASNPLVANKEKIKITLEHLIPPTPTKAEQKEKALLAIGEQAADSACDAQASNVNVGKNFMNSFDNAIQNIDKTYMGATR